MKIEGSVKVIGETETFGTNGFAKRQLVVTTEDQYPQHISVEFLQDSVDYLDNLAIGDNVNITIQFRGREWTSPQGEVKYFNSIVGLSIEKINNLV